MEISVNELDNCKVYYSFMPHLPFQLIGLGHIDVNYVFPGLNSCASFNQTDKFAISINSTVDSKVLQKEILVLKLKQNIKKFYRYAEYKKWSTFSGNSYHESDIRFTLSDRGNNERILEIDTMLEPGEYAIAVPDSHKAFKLFAIE